MWYSQVAEAAKAKKKKTKLISTGGTTAKGLNPRQKLYCVCKTPYDESRFVEILFKSWVETSFDIEMLWLVQKKHFKLNRLELGLFSSGFRKLKIMPIFKELFIGVLLALVCFKKIQSLS